MPTRMAVGATHTRDSNNHRDYASRLQKPEGGNLRKGRGSVPEKIQLSNKADWPVPTRATVGATHSRDPNTHRDYVSLLQKPEGGNLRKGRGSVPEKIQLSNKADWPVPTRATVGATHSRDSNNHRDYASLLQKPEGGNLRKGRVSIPGQIYLITTVTQYRNPVFTDFRAARLLVQSLILEQRRRTADTMAYVIMPDHLHWLLTLGKDKSLSQVVQAIKASSAKRIGQPIWQAGFHDHAVRREEDIKTLARYIIANPLRAGLVDRIGDYPHWDAIWF